MRRMLSVLVPCLVLGCDRGPVAPEARGPSAPAARRFALTGTVEAVEPGRGTVAIAHGEIPGLMPAMVMDFTPADRSLLEDVVPGDEVEGAVRATYGADGRLGSIELVDLVVSRPAVAAPPPASPRPPRLEPGQVVPDFAMTGQDGETFRLSDLRGHVVVLTFIYTRCPQPDYCPLMDRKFAELAARIGRSPRRSGGMRLLSVSFDPEHDTPAVLARHAEGVGARAPVWTFCVAAHAELAAVAGPLGLEYAPLSGEIRHGLSTALIGRDGRLIRLETGGAWSPDEMLAEADGL